MASNNFDLPDNVPVIDQGGNTALAWAQWFARVQRIVSSAQSSGVTADRPVKGLWIGRTYFDSTIGMPIWVLSVNPAVWVNAAGVVV
jgi:hypothetical protein